MDRVLRSGSGESEIEYSESLVPHAKGINIWGPMRKISLFLIRICSGWMGIQL
jgi:hypothetical protein